MVTRQGGFQFGRGNNTIEGDLWAYGKVKGAVPATVKLSPWRTFNNPPKGVDKARAYGNYAFSAIHELFHLAKYGGFSDEQVARAAHSVAGTMPPKFSADDHLSWSGNFDAELFKHCKKTGAGKL